MGSLPSGPVGPALTMGGPPTPTGQLAITGGRHHPLVKPDFSLPTPKTTVTSLGVPEIQKLTGPNPTSHNINLANQIRSSEASRKRSRNHEINLISYQKEVNCSLGFMSGPDRIILICTQRFFQIYFPLETSISWGYPQYFCLFPDTKLTKISLYRIRNISRGVKWCLCDEREAQTAGRKVSSSLLFRSPWGFYWFPPSARIKSSQYIIFSTPWELFPLVPSFVMRPIGHFKIHTFII